MSETFVRWDAANHLTNKEDVRLYLEACVERPGRRELERAQNMGQLAREIGMTPEGLYEALTENDNLSFATVMQITLALGMRLRITA